MADPSSRSFPRALTGPTLPPSSGGIAILAAFAIVAALYFARAIFVPLAVAILLTFVLAPVVRLLRGGGVPRVPSVAIVVVLAFLIIFGLGGVMGQQVAQLADKLPQYQYTIQEKIRTLRDAASSGETLARLS